jgi:hypothetical protein
MYSIKLDLQDDVLVELGTSIVLFNLLELVLDDIITFFMARAIEEDAADIFFAELSFKQRVALIDSLLRWVTAHAQLHEGVEIIDSMNPPASKMLEQWEEMRIRAAKVEQDRNALVHSRWFGRDGLSVEIFRRDEETSVVGSAKMVFGSRDTEGEPAEPEITGAHVALRQKTTAKVGEGLRRQSELVTLTELKDSNTRLAEALFATALFGQYFDQAAPDTLAEAVAHWIATAKLDRENGNLP